VHDEHVEAEQEEDHHSRRHVPRPVFRFAHFSSYFAKLATPSPEATIPMVSASEL